MVRWTGSVVTNNNVFFIFLLPCRACTRTNVAELYLLQSVAGELHLMELSPDAERIKAVCAACVESHPGMQCFLARSITKAQFRPDTKYKHTYTVCVHTYSLFVLARSSGRAFLSGTDVAYC
jgi:hypothetical protein